MIIVRDSLFRDVLEFRTGEKEVPEGWHRADPTDILELSLYFRFPEVLAPVVPKVKPTRERPMMRMKDEFGAIRLSDSGADYREPIPKAVLVDDETRPGSNVKDLKTVYIQQPWRRITPKPVRPGRARRTRLWTERYGEFA